MKRRTVGQDVDVIVDDDNNNDTSSSGSDSDSDNDNDNDNDTNTNTNTNTNNNDNNNINMFSKALLNLTFNDRNQIEEEIHGVSCMSINETPKLIEESLYQFDIELDLIPIENKIAYNKAVKVRTKVKNAAQQDPDPSASMQMHSYSYSYLLSKDTKLRFLRSEFFDTQKGALRYTKYIDLLLDIYGEYALMRPIRLQDLNREELSFLRTGQYQLLPYRDRGGRRILAIVSNNKDHVPRKVLVSLYYVIISIVLMGKKA
jgi:hypothetical protein